MGAAQEHPATDAGALDEARRAFAARRFDGAARAAARALASGPPAQAAEASALRVGALLAAGRPGPAMAALKDASALTPGESWVHRLRALALLDLGRPVAAAAEADEAAQLAPEDAWAQDA